MKPGGRAGWPERAGRNELEDIGARLGFAADRERKLAAIPS
jgi:hypothetical protein